jgi:hypothetical protein
MLNKYSSLLNGAWCFWWCELELIAMSSWAGQHPHPLKPGTEGRESLPGTYTVEGTREDCSKFNYFNMVTPIQCLAL